MTSVFSRVTSQSQGPIQGFSQPKKRHARVGKSLRSWRIRLLFGLKGMSAWEMAACMGAHSAHQVGTQSILPLNYHSHLPALQFSVSFTTLHPVALTSSHWSSTAVYSYQTSHHMGLHALALVLLTGADSPSQLTFTLESL
jgi:hypothetical protein